MKDPDKGKITTHGDGLGDFTEKDINVRAGEIAAIAGRPGEVSETDRTRARKELRGELVPGDADDEKVLPEVTRDPSEPASVSGSRTPETKADDESASAERLAAEGVEEAAHDQMLASRRREREQR